MHHTAAVNSLGLSITGTVYNFIGGCRLLSGSGNEGVQYWKEWLFKYALQESPIYHAKKHAWKHIHVSETVDFGLGS